MEAGEVDQVTYMIDGHLQFIVVSQLSDAMPLYPLSSCPTPLQPRAEPSAQKQTQIPQKHATCPIRSDPIRSHARANANAHAMQDKTTTRDRTASVRFPRRKISYKKIREG